MGNSIYNLGDMLDAVGAELGDEHPALIHGDRVVSWPEMTARSNNLARALRARGVETGDKAGFYLRNQPEYMEALVACFKGRFTHVNVNYRYLDDELTYIFDNSDAAIVFFDREFRENVDRVKDRLPKVKVWVEIGGDGSDTPDYAIDYETLAADGDGSPLDIERSDDDLFFLYTGGTTGMPKGVMWSHKIWRQSSREAMLKVYGFAPSNMEEHLGFVHEVGKLSRQLPACPLMHGTGLFTAMGSIISGGAIVTLENTKRFDPEELWKTVDRHGVTAMAIVGDAFAKPMLRVLDENPGAYEGFRKPRNSRLATIARCSPKTGKKSCLAPACRAILPAAAPCRLAITRTRKSPPRPSGRLMGCVTPCRVTGAQLKKTARSHCSAAAPIASTRRARKSTPKKSKKPLKIMTLYAMRWW